MTITRAVSITTAFFLLATSHGAWAAPSDSQRGALAQGRGPIPTGIRKVVFAIPGLTSEQKTRVTDLASVARMRSAPLREQVSAARRYIASLWAADALDKEAIARKQAELDGAVAKLRGIWGEFFTELHDLLKTEQRSWLALRSPGIQIDAVGESATADCPCNQR